MADLISGPQALGHGLRKGPGRTVAHTPRRLSWRQRREAELRRWRQNLQAREAAEAEARRLDAAFSAVCAAPDDSASWSMPRAPSSPQRNSEA